MPLADDAKAAGQTAAATVKARPVAGSVRPTAKIAHASRICTSKAQPRRCPRLRVRIGSGEEHRITADLVVDLVGGAYVGASVEAAAPRARLMLIGAVGGSEVRQPVHAGQRPVEPEFA